MKAPVRILIVDDDEDDFFILKQYIKTIPDQELIVDWCGKYQDGLQKMYDKEYDMYFVDYLLGAKTGIDLIKEANEKNCEEPIILLTGNGNRVIDIQAMQYGAVDYLVKSELSTEKIERCIRYSLERSKSLKALRSNERKFRNMFERSKDIVFIANDKLCFTEVNDAAFSILEYKRSELISKSLYSFLANKADADFIKQQLFTEGLVADKEIDVLTKESETKNCIITISRENDISGNTYFQGIIHEITALKKAEKTNLTLEKMKMASRLVRTMAHEVRNPLNNIMISLEQLKYTSTNDEDTIYFDIIHRNGRRINDLITELLNSSRPVETLLEKRSLQAILEESIDSTFDRINLHNIHLQRDYLDEEAWIMADYEKLKIAFVNIIINAVEAMQKNDGELKVSVKPRNDNQYAVTIQDNGCGISDDNLVRLFEPYFTTKQSGLGLGLSSTLNILQSHNASVDVDSKLEKGTSFKLLFNKAE